MQINITTARRMFTSGALSQAANDPAHSGAGNNVPAEADTD